MNRIEQCPVCDLQPTRVWPGLVAPFIAEFVLNAPVEVCRLFECERCGLRFFAERFTEGELAKLYEDYRGERYFRTRHRHEPWYSATYNQWIGRDGNRAPARRAALRAFLLDSGASGPFEQILDYGGDGGQLIPTELTKRSFVFDISGAAPATGVTALSEEQVQVGKYELILLSHVLEHAPDPVELLRTTRALSPEFGWIYVEVPLERPKMTFVGRGSIAAAYLDALRRTPALLMCVDFYSSGFRVKSNIIPPFGFPKLHEHINFFSMKSLRLAMERSGWEIVRTAPVYSERQKDDSGAIACVARARRSS